jgi:hypothetical protein
MVLFDQRFVGFFNFFDCGRLGNSENPNPVFFVLGIAGRRRHFLTGRNIGFVD